MAFAQITDPKELDRLVSSYIKAHNDLTSRRRGETSRVQNLAQQSTIINAPVVKAIKKLEDTVEAQIANDKAIAQELQADAKKTKAEEKAEDSEFAGSGRDVFKAVGNKKAGLTEIKKIGDKFVFGGERREVDESLLKKGKLKIDGMPEININSPGLIELLTIPHSILKKNSNPEYRAKHGPLSINSQDVLVYKTILEQTNLGRANNSKKAEFALRRRDPWKAFSESYGLTSGESKGDEDGGSEGVAETKSSGSGIALENSMNFRACENPEILLNRLAVCCGSVNAGNRSKHLEKEIIQILDRLLTMKQISKAEHKAMHEAYVR